jgi:hypothetical protein
MKRAILPAQAKPCSLPGRANGGLSPLDKTGICNNNAYELLAGALSLCLTVVVLPLPFTF